MFPLFKKIVSSFKQKTLEDKSEELIQVLLNEPDKLLKYSTKSLNIQSPKGLTILMQSILHGVNHGFELLMQKNVNVNLFDNKKQTALMMACVNYPQAIPVLLKAGANVNAINQIGENALHIAVWRNPKYVKLLLTAGADVNLKDHAGMTPLMQTAMQVYKDEDVEKITLLLIKAGADINLKNNIGQTVFDIAEQLNPFLIDILHSYTENKEFRNTYKNELKRKPSVL